jgi:uncharacterized membrane-anchored protein
MWRDYTADSVVESIPMTVRMGVIAVLVAFVATASAQGAETKAENAKPSAKQKQDAKKKPPAPPPEPIAEAAGDDAPLTEEEILAGMPPHVRGPKLVDLGHNVEIELPEGLILFERAEAQRIVQQGGGSAENVLGAVIKLDAEWLVVLEFADIGYVNDDDADQLDAGELFAQYQEGTRIQNERRRQLGIPELFLDGWSEMPKYHKAQHQLVWGLRGHTVGEDGGPVINFFTRLLGRHGYLSINLIDAPDRIEQSKLEAAPLLAATRFMTGYTYADYREGDRNSGIGLRALVLGGTGVAVMKAAKAGFLVKLLLVFKKGFIVIILAVGGLLKWLLGRKKQEDELPAYGYDETSGGAPPSDPDDPPPSAPPQQG